MGDSLKTETYLSLIDERARLEALLAKADLLRPRLDYIKRELDRRRCAAIIRHYNGVPDKILSLLAEAGHPGLSSREIVKIFAWRWPGVDNPGSIRTALSRMKQSGTIYWRGGDTSLYSLFSKPKRTPSREKSLGARIVFTHYQSDHSAAPESL